jgi:hypothetical protein
MTGCGWLQRLPLLAFIRDGGLNRREGALASMDDMPNIPRHAGSRDEAANIASRPVGANSR